MKNTITLSLIILTLLISCSSEENKSAQLEQLKIELNEIQEKITQLESELDTDTSQVIDSIPVTLLALENEVFKNFIDVQGRIDAEENTAVSTQMPGTITKILVNVGENVVEGQILAETDSRALQQQILDLNENLELATQLYEKRKGLWVEHKIGTEVEYLQAKTNKLSLERKLAAMQEQLRMTKIISPINGTIDAVNIKIGETTAPGMPAIRVINFSKLKVTAELAESYAGKIKRGASVIIKFPDLDDTLYSKVNFVSKSIKAETRTFTVESVLKGSKNYYPNMIASLSINDYQSDSALVTIPVKVIQRDDQNQQFVYVSRNGQAVQQPIKLGNKYKGKAEVLSGLSAGDLLLIEGYNIVQEGDFVSSK